MDSHGIFYQVYHNRYDMRVEYHDILLNAAALRVSMSIFTCLLVCSTKNVCTCRLFYCLHELVVVIAIPRCAAH